ncbi:MAG TPA: hypothetical protein VMG12_28605 [Polyangiaceae bacterium]|nr:hypothetical protein [Polyangiaceae bacterium]
MRAAGSVGLVLAAFALGGCGSDAGDGGASVGAGSESDGSEEGVTGSPAAPGVGGNGVAGDGLVEEVAVGDACASQVAADTFTAAVCSCEDTRVAGYLRTTSFRSRPRAGVPADAVGSVGVNRDYVTAGYADVSGSFVVAGSRDIAFGGYLKAGEDVRVSPALDVAGLVEVGRDVFLKSDARVFGKVEIGRDLYLEPGSDISGIALVDVGGQRRSEAVQVDAPCGCAPEQIIDVAALVDAAQSDNDNARAGLEPDDLNVVVGIGAEVTLPGGRYFVHQLGGVGSLTLHVTGNTALFVQDDLVATGLFRVELAPDAELDVFVRDNLVVTGAARFGDPSRPSATRIYVGGTGDVAIAGASAFVGNLYAPTANILVGGVGQVQGSLFGKNVIAAGFLDLGYDASVRDGGEACPPLEPGDIPRIR